MKRLTSITTTVTTVLMLVMLATASWAQPTGNDREILGDLYNMTGGDNWTNNTGWKTDDADWYGVTTDSYGRVLDLNLAGNNLTGTLPAGFGNLSFTWRINLQGNNLTGDIPNLSDAGTLISLSLNHNLGLSGSFPSEVTGLRNLRYIHLGVTGISGRIPDDIGNLTPLSFLRLSSTRMSGGVPESVGRLSQLRVLELSAGFSGELPRSMLQIPTCDQPYGTGCGAIDNGGEGLFVLHAGGSSVCAPGDSEFQLWLSGIGDAEVETCAAAPVTPDPTPDPDPTPTPTPALPLVGVWLLGFGLVGIGLRRKASRSPRS